MPLLPRAQPGARVSTSAFLDAMLIIDAIEKAADGAFRRHGC